MNIPISLSYTITTKNKLPYLRRAIEKLLANKKKDEEILIADGGSTDGTLPYLEDLKTKGKIEYLVSKLDYGESHALNKLFLEAHGEIITIVTDDDVFDFLSIKLCREFMLAHPKIDLISTEGGLFHKTSKSLNESPLELIRALDYRKNYLEYKKNHTPFSFCGLGIMFRRSSLPVIGLWNTDFRAADAEFSFRTTASPANIAWYTGYSFVNISNPQSVSLVYKNKIRNEMDRLNKLYLRKDPDSFVIQKIRALPLQLHKMLSRNKQRQDELESCWPELVAVAEQWLKIKNKEKKTEFLWDEKKYI